MYNSFKLPPPAGAASPPPLAKQGKDQKRLKVSLACNPCRKNKTKCDGNAPCAHCVSQPEACIYDGTDGRRANAHKRSLEDAQLERDQLQRVFKRLRESDAQSAALLYARIRQGEDMEDLLKLTDESELARATTNPSIEKAVVTMLSGTQIAFEGAVEYIAPNTSNDIWEVSTPSNGPSRDSVSWIRTPIGKPLAQNLLDIYFCWLHHHIPMFSKTYFLEGLESGDPRYCSSILMNAMLSASCFYCQMSTLEDSILGGTDFRGLSSDFMSEAETLLAAESFRGDSSMTSVQALVILAFSYVQLDDNAKARMWNCLGRASIMMHTLNLDNHLGDQLKARTEAASITFWGLLMADRLGTHICGRRGHVRTTGRPRRPLYVEANEHDMWIAINSTVPIVPRKEHFVEIASAQHDLFNIIDEIQSFSYLFRAPLKVVEINSMYRKLQDWKFFLPPGMHDLDEAAPNLFHLMAMYHAVILRLFRPLAQTSNLTFVVDPKVACDEAAAAIVQLEVAYEKDFGAYFSNIYHLHHIFAASCTYLGDLGTPDSLALFIKCLRLMNGLEQRFTGPVQRAFQCLFHLLWKWEKLTPAVWAAVNGIGLVAWPYSSLPDILERYSPSHGTTTVLLTADQNAAIYSETRLALETGDFDFLFSDWLKADIFRTEQPPPGT